jgi:hypothetical protein
VTSGVVALHALLGRRVLPHFQEIGDAGVASREKQTDLRPSALLEAFSNHDAARSPKKDIILPASRARAAPSEDGRDDRVKAPVG